MPASTVRSCEYDLAFNSGIEGDDTTYEITYSVPDVPATLGTDFFESVETFNTSESLVKDFYTYPATNIARGEGHPAFTHIKQARIVETVRTPIER